MEVVRPQGDPVVERLGADLVSEFAGWLIGNKEWNELKKLLNDIKTNGSNSSMALASYANGVFIIAGQAIARTSLCSRFKKINYTSAIDRY